MSMSILTTAFHARTADRNLANAWVRRGAYTVPARYGDSGQEALAARVSSALIDASPFEELRIEGDHAASLLAAACGPAALSLSPGRSLPVHWCADGGGVRGVGTLARLDDRTFMLTGADADAFWFTRAAPRFGVTVRDATAERGLLHLVGPFASAVLREAGLEKAGELAPGEHVRQDWHGLAIAFARTIQANTYLIRCSADDAVLVFDRLTRVGEPLGLRLAGQEAFELLQLEAGLAIPHVDFEPAREDFASEPAPSSLGLGGDAGEPPPARVFAGIELDSAEPCAFASIYREQTQVGRTLRSAYSLALVRSIALAQIDPAAAVAGTVLSVRCANGSGVEDMPARVVALPFL